MTVIKKKVNGIKEIQEMTGLKKCKRWAFPIGLSANTVVAGILCKILCRGECMAKQHFAVSEAILMRAVTQFI